MISSMLEGVGYSMQQKNNFLCKNVFKKINVYDKIIKTIKDVIKYYGKT